jgi:hypothetical protein
VRLDDEAEATLAEIRRATGLPISEVFKRGLRSLREHLEEHTPQSPYQVYERLDLGEGGYAKASSSEAREAVKRAIRKKLNR